MNCQNKVTQFRFHQNCLTNYNIKKLNFQIPFSKNLDQQFQLQTSNMLKISCSNITFQPRQKNKNLTLTNQLNQPIIYKVKTNNIDAIQAKPNCGFIKPNTSLSLLVKALKNSAFEAKIQIIYSSIQNQGSLDGVQNHHFPNYWALIEKSAFKNILVNVKKIQQENTNHSGQVFFSQNVQQVETRISQTKHTVQSFSQHNSTQREKDHILQTNGMKSIKNSVARDNFQRDEVEKQLLIEKGRTAKLKQQLDITQGKLKELSDGQIQTKINRTMGIVCEQHHTSFTTLVLIGLFCLVLGFVLGKSG